MLNAIRFPGATLAAAALLVTSAIAPSVALAATRPDAPPKNVTVTASKDAAVVQWTSAATNHKGFRVARYNRATNKWVVLGSTAATVTTFTDAAPGAGRNFYHVCAFNADGDYCSNAVYFGFDHAEPPSGLTGKLVSGAAQLSWTNSAAPQDGVRVYRWDQSGKTWKRLGSTLAAAAVFTDSTPGIGRQHYHVCAFDAKGEFCSSITGVGSDYADPPADLSAKFASGAMQLTWTNGSSAQDGVRVYRFDASARSWVRIGSVAASAATFTDPNPGTSRQNYHVCAFNSKGERCSNGVAAGYDRPEAPTALAASLTGGTVQLSWTNGPAPQNGVRVYRWDSSASRWTLLGSAAGSATSFTDTSAGTVRQHYHVCAFDAKGDVCSQVASVGAAYPDAPSGLAGTRTGTGVQLRWTNGSVAQTGIHVARWDRTAHKWVQIATLPANATTYTDTAATGRQYYHISAFNANGERFSSVIGVS